MKKIKILILSETFGQRQFFLFKLYKILHGFNYNLLSPLGKNYGTKNSTEAFTVLKQQTPDVFLILSYDYKEIHSLLKILNKDFPDLLVIVVNTKRDYKINKRNYPNAKHLKQISINKLANIPTLFRKYLLEKPKR